MYLAIKPIFLTSQAPSLAGQFLQTIARVRPFCFHRVLIKLVEINLTSGPKIGEYYKERSMKSRFHVLIMFGWRLKRIESSAKDSRSSYLLP